jgi:hypothetical protein
MLEERFDKDEAVRFEILKPLRAFIRENYQVVNIFGGQILFEHQAATASQESS